MSTLDLLNDFTETCFTADKEKTYTVYLNSLDILCLSGGLWINYAAKRLWVLPPTPAWVFSTAIFHEAERTAMSFFTGETSPVRQLQREEYRQLSHHPLKYSAVSSDSDTLAEIFSRTTESFCPLRAKKDRQLQSNMS